MEQDRVPGEPICALCHQPIRASQSRMRVQETDFHSACYERTHLPARRSGGGGKATTGQVIRATRGADRDSVAEPSAPPDLCGDCGDRLLSRRAALRVQILRLRGLRAAVRSQGERYRHLEGLVARTIEKTRELLRRRRLARRGVTILVVEDEETVRESIRLLLEDLGMRVVVARDGLDGLTAAAMEQPDLILTDLRMPRMDGWQLVRRVRETPGLAGIPVVAVSAFVTPDEGPRLEAAGFDAWLAKPFDPAELSAVLERARRHHDAA